MAKCWNKKNIRKEIKKELALYYEHSSIMNIVQKTRAIFRKLEHCSEDRREDDLMSVELILATSSITLALVFYTIGVFKERKAGILRLNHVLFFWTGLVFDVTGTTIMTSIAQSSAAAAAAGDFGIHGLTYSCLLGNDHLSAPQ